MAKNFVEEGKTVAIVASAAISSGDLVLVGDVFWADAGTSAEEVPVKLNV
ncbi:TPA: hypothetical protein ACWXI0_004579 [Escherichia coli]